MSNTSKLTIMETINFTRESNGTFVFPQVSKSAAKAKFRRMLSGAGYFGSKHFTVGFANWSLNEETIECNTTYHSEATILDMYSTNCREW